jgi:class 3 adenylate cyclase
MCRFTTWSDQLAELELADWLDTYLNQVNATVL